MRRAIAAVLAMITLVGGCSAAVDKQAFLPQITALCAGVNDRLEETVTENVPQVAAEELTTLVGTVRDGAVPEEDRQLLRRLLDSFEATAARFRAAAEARDRGEDELAKVEAETAEERLRETSELAIDYGMPPLSECDEVRDNEVAAPWESEAPEPRPASAPSDAPSEPEIADEPMPAGPGWAASVDARVARQQVAAARVGGLLYVAGGIADGTGTSQVEALDTTVQRWRSAPELPIPLHDAMAVNYRGNMIVLGGWRSSGDVLNAEVSDRVFALRRNRWVDLPRLQRPRAGGAAAVVDDTIVVTGGHSGDRLIVETEIYDRGEDAWRDGAELPTPRRDLAAASDGRYVYAVGGRDLTSDLPLDTNERYDPATGMWETRAPMPTARGNLGADVVDGRVVAIGGERPTGVLSKAEAYDPGADTWTEFPSLPTARHGAGVVTVRSVVYVINGGEGAALTNPSTAVAVLQPPPRQLQPVAGWSDLDAAQLARQQTATAEIDGQIWVVGGLEEANVATTRVTRLNPETGRWRRAPDLPEPLHHAMGVNLDGELVVLGGWVGGGANPTSETSNRVYVLRDGDWERLASLNHARAAGAATIVDGRIVAVGGIADNELVAETEVYDPDTNEWRVGAVIPTPREHLAADALGGYVYAVGGWTAGPDESSAALERYDPDADEWTSLASMPTRRGSVAATIIDGRLVVVGGETSDGVLDVVELYDIGSDEWRAGPSLPTARHGPGVAAVGSLVCVIGGARRRGHNGSTTEVDVLRFE